MLVDLSHAVEDGMRTYPDLPAPRVRDWLTHADSAQRYAEGVGFHFGEVTMLGNTGTWVDAPYHRYEDGDDVAALPLARLADLPLTVLHRSAGAASPIEKQEVAELPLDGRALLVHTGWSRHWRTEAYGAGGHPFLTRGAAEHLVEAGVRFVGVDAINVDDTGDPTRPAHSILLARGIPIGEHFTALDRLPEEGARLHAAPVKVRGLGTFPVRAYAVVPE